MFVSGRVPKPDVVGRQFRWNNSPFDSVRFICDFFSGMGIFLVSLGPCRKLRWQWNITISNIYIYTYIYKRYIFKWLFLFFHCHDSFRVFYFWKNNITRKTCLDCWDRKEQLAVGDHPRNFVPALCITVVTPR